MSEQPHEQNRLNFYRSGQVNTSDVQRRIVNLQQILADIDFAHAIEIKKLRFREGDSERLPALIESLKEMHDQRREPFARRLAELSADTTG